MTAAPKIACFAFFTLLFHASYAQLLLSGTVLDKSKVNFVEGARVISTGGGLAFTDSLGHYNIRVAKTDSVFFVYNDKPTQKFPVRAITDPAHFDISVFVPVKGRYHVLQEVVVHTRSYGEDSAENRETYDNVFSYHKPRVATSISPGGGVGMDADEIINIFRFRHNREMKAFQKRLQAQEEDKYVDYRFSKTTVRRITQLNSPALDTFMVWYRPTYEFVANAGEMAFDQYVLNALYQYQELTGAGGIRKPEEGD